MKINIYTMHRIINYGSVLQAYGMKRELEFKGGKVFFTDYKPSKNFWKNYLIMLVRPIVLKIKCCFLMQKNDRNRFIKKRNMNFLTKYQKILGISCIPNFNFDGDISVIGSDEVFNVCQNSLWKGSMHYFGGFIPRGKIYSYAASFGDTTIELIQKDNLVNEIKKCINQFDAISVRDCNSISILNDLCSKK